MSETQVTQNMKPILIILLVSTAFSVAAQSIYLPAKAARTNEVDAVITATRLLESSSPAIKAQGLDLMIQLANGGSVPAALQVGKYYSNNNAREKAVEFYLIAARKGNVDAQVTLAARYYNDNNYAEAFKWYQQAASKGNREAKNGLAFCFFKGHGTAKNIPRAIQLYEETEYFQGIAGITENPVEKYKWLRVAQLSGKDVDSNLKDFVAKYPKPVIDQGEPLAQSYYNKRFGKK